ncbi:MAG: deoxyribonuclease IV [Thermoplasmatota archaeon]
MGAHVSVAGGIGNSIERAEDIGCESFQIFTKNQRQWRAPPLDQKEISAFRKDLEISGMGPLISHDSYLINLAAPDPGVFRRSVDALSDEITRAEAVGADFLVVHPGSHLGEGIRNGIGRIAEAIDIAWSGHEDPPIPGKGTMILLETTAGQGTSVGFEFSHLTDIIELTSIPDRLGICFDTCHAFAAGYNISSAEGYEKVMDDLLAVAGRDRIRAFHLNDSKKGAGSRVDRHENIGEGMIGIGAFELLVNDRRFESIPMILETPGGDEMYRKNIELLKSLRKRT